MKNSLFQLQNAGKANVLTRDELKKINGGGPPTVIGCNDIDAQAPFYCHPGNHCINGICTPDINT